jgi:hypothetical protein
MKPITVPPIAEGPMPAGFRAIISVVGEGRGYREMFSITTSGTSDIIIRFNALHGTNFTSSCIRGNVRSVDQDTLLRPASCRIRKRNRRQSCTTSRRDLSDDEYVLAGDAICVTSVDSASATAHRPAVWDIRVVKSDVRLVHRPAVDAFVLCFVCFNGFHHAGRRLHQRLRQRSVTYPTDIRLD